MSAWLKEVRIAILRLLNIGKNKKVKKKIIKVSQSEKSGCETFFIALVVQF